jgi:hypothetical protein
MLRTLIGWWIRCWSRTVTNIQSHQGVTLGGFDHHVDFDFFISQTDALFARADFDRRNS